MATFHGIISSMDMVHENQSVLTQIPIPDKHHFVGLCCFAWGGGGGGTVNQFLL